MVNKNYEHIKGTNLENGLEKEKPYIKLLNITADYYHLGYDCTNYSKRPFEEEVLIYIKNSLNYNYSIKKTDRILEGLPCREKEILKLRSGFDGEPKTLEQIAKIFFLTPERIRMIEGKAKRMFRHRYESYDKIKDQVEEQQEKIRRQIKYLKDNKEIFSQKIEDLNFLAVPKNISTRIKKALTNKGIEYVSDLIQKSEHDLSYCRGLGAKSIQGIKKILSEKGLWLDFKMGDITKYFR